MITKERLLAGLNEAIQAEEGMVTLYASFSKALVNETEDLDEGKKKDINRILSRLYRDTSRHKEIIDGLIRQVEGSAKNEY